MIHSVSEKGGALRLPDLPMLSGLRWLRRKGLTDGEQGQARFQVRLMEVIHRGDLGTLLSVVEQAKERFLQSPTRFNAHESFRLFENLIDIVKIRERQVITATMDVPKEGGQARELSRARLRLDKAREDLREVVCWVARNELRDNGRKSAEYALRKFDGIAVEERKRLFEEIGRCVQAKFVAVYPELDPRCLREIEQVVEEVRPELEAWLSVQRPQQEPSFSADDVEHGVPQVVPASGNPSGTYRSYRGAPPGLGQILDIRI